MIKVEIEPFVKTLFVPFSKSYLNRALILASLNPKNVCIYGNSQASDVTNLITCLKKIGLVVEMSATKILIKNNFPNCEKKSSSTIELNTDDGGTTVRFLLPLLALGTNEYRIQLSERMFERPLDETFRILKELKVKISKDKNCIIVQGPVSEVSTVTVDCEKTTQEASGFLMALSQKTIDFKIINTQKSKTYLDLTYKMLGEKEFVEFNSPVDFSSMSYPLALAATIGEVTISHCHEIDLLQADSKFLVILNELGFVCHFSDKGLTVKKKDEYHGFSLDCGDCLDLVPTLAFLASYAKSQSKLSNLKNLQFKESNRLKEILKILNEFQVGHQYDSIKDVLVINGSAPSVGVKNIVGINDHRIVMMSYLFLRKNQGGTLHHEEAVNKSFPGFFEIMK